MALITEICGDKGYMKKGGKAKLNVERSVRQP